MHIGGVAVSPASLVWQETPCQTGGLVTCHLCTSLMRDPVTEAVVRAVGERHEAEVFASFITGAQVTAVNALSG